MFKKLTKKVLIAFAAVVVLVLCAALISSWGLKEKLIGKDSKEIQADNHPRGAQLPFIELEAEDGNTNGKLIGPSTKLYDEASEASGRKAVKLQTEGSFVEWTVPKPANTIVVRYSIPNSSDGTGINSTLSLYVNDKKVQSLSLTSKYAWEYGNYPWSKNPKDGKAHRFYDEIHTFIDNVNAGDKIKLQKDSEDTAEYFTIDLIDLEYVGAPKAMPEGFLSITDFGAISDDGKDDTYAIRQCIAEAKKTGKGVWIPKGTFNMETLNVENITFRGAGMWYSTLAGRLARFNTVGDNCKFYDFAMFGETTKRDDNSPIDNAFGGWPGKDSVLDGIWVEHKKCAFWVGEPSKLKPVENLKIVNSRFRNLMADAVNFCNGTSNSLVENCHIRYSGDDALATWSPSSNVGCNNNTFRNNTIQLPWLASGIAVYGGSNHTIEYNVVSDTVTGGSGIYISSNFNPVPLSGVITARGNTLIRTGSNECYTGAAPGSIRLLAYNSDVKDAQIIIENTEIKDAVQSGISFQGPKAMTGVTIKNVNIDGAESFGILVNGNISGSAVIENVTVKNTKKEGILNAAKDKFTITKGKGNSGW